MAEALTRLTMTLLFVLGITIFSSIYYLFSRRVSEVSRAAMLSTIFLVTTVFSIGWLISPGLRYENAAIPLTLILISGVAALMASLYIGGVIFNILKLSDSNEALGLPKGSVRALIALSLIVIYALMSVFLFQEIGGTEPPNAEAINIAQQTLTTISTLVVAVAGFYFGTRSVETAKRAVEKPSITILSPTDPLELSGAKNTKSPTIKIEVTPSGEAIEWSAEPDNLGVLSQVKPYEFEYLRTTDTTDVVKLTFSLYKFPDITATLNIKSI